MPRNRLLTFAALLALHAAGSLVACCVSDQVACSGGPKWLAEGLAHPLPLPPGLLGQTGEDPPDLGAAVGVPVSSDLWPVLALGVNSLLWVTGACGLWLAGRWACRRIARLHQRQRRAHP